MLVFSQKTQAEFSLQSLLWTCFITEFLWQNSYQTVVSQARKHKNNTGQVQVSSSMTYRILLSRMKHTLRYMTPKMKYVTRVLHLSHKWMENNAKLRYFHVFLSYSFYFASGIWGRKCTFSFPPFWQEQKLSHTFRVSSTGQLPMGKAKDLPFPTLFSLPSSEAKRYIMNIGHAVPAVSLLW